MNATPPAITQQPLPDEEPWLQRSSENNLWYDRFARFLALGAARSVRSVYQAERGNDASKAVPASWTDASHRFDWPVRAKAYDARQRQAIFEHGNALDTERVKKLDDLAERMHTKLLADFDTMPVNDRFMAQYLAVLDMLAKLTGGYAAQRIEHTGKDGGKIEVEETKINVIWYMPEIAETPAISGIEDAGSSVQSDGVNV